MTRPPQPVYHARPRVDRPQDPPGPVANALLLAYFLHMEAHTLQRLTYQAQQAHEAVHHCRVQQALPTMKCTPR